MDRVVPVCAFLDQAGHQQPIGLDHDLRIARLHGEDKVMVAQVARDAGKLQRALHHAERRVAVAVHDTVAKAAVIGADTHGHAARPAQLDQRREALANAAQLSLILLVGVFDDLELLAIRVITGVDAHLLHPLRRLHRRLGLEMDVRHDRHVTAQGSQPGDDMFQIRRVLHRRRGDPHDLAADIDQVHGLRDALGRVHRVTRQHGLHTDRIATADADLAHVHRP